MFPCCVPQSHGQVLVCVGQQIEARIAELFDNVAFIILGSRDLTEDDKEYITVCGQSPVLFIAFYRIK